MNSFVTTKTKLMMNKYFLGSYARKKEAYHGNNASITKMSYFDAHFRMFDVFLVCLDSDILHLNRDD